MPLNSKRILSGIRLVSLLVLTVPAGASPEGAYGPESVVVVANSRMEGSIKVARAYLSRRAIPESNLVIIEAPTSEKISREEYIKDVHNPVLDALVSRDRVNAFTGEADAFGRATVTARTGQTRRASPREQHGLISRMTGSVQTVDAQRKIS